MKSPNRNAEGNARSEGKQLQIEYAKSGRSSCKTCKNVIGKGALRIGKMILARQFDAVMPNWHHAECFFKYPSEIHTTDDFNGFEDISTSDQEKILEILRNSGNTRHADAEGLNESIIEVSKTSRATCKSCNGKIAKGEVRISTTADPEMPWARATVSSWRHARCFFKMGWWNKPIKAMVGWETLPSEEKVSVQLIAKEFTEDFQTGQESDTSANHLKNIPKPENGKEGMNEQESKKRKYEDCSFDSVQGLEGIFNEIKKMNVDLEGFEATRIETSNNRKVDGKADSGQQQLTSLDEARKCIEKFRTNFECLQRQNEKLRTVNRLAKDMLEKEFSSVPVMDHHKEEIAKFSVDQRPFMTVIYQACLYKQNARNQN